MCAGQTHISEKYEGVKNNKMTYELLKKDGKAKRARFHTVHGTIETPVFMNVGTAAAIKGAVSTDDLRQIKTQVELSNTYHLHVRPGDEVIKKLGGLHRFMNWDRPILTDSGGFQVFSLSSLRKIKEEGVHFHSHVDGRKIFMGPEESMQIQSNLASTIAMAFDECAPAKAERDYIERSVERTTRWLARCKADSIGLSAIGGQLCHCPPSSGTGLALQLDSSSERKVRAAIAPGLFVEAGIVSQQTMTRGTSFPVQQPAVLALDGEREVVLRKKDEAHVRLAQRGVQVVDVARTLEEARRKRVFVRG